MGEEILRKGGNRGLAIGKRGGQGNLLDDKGEQLQEEGAWERAAGRGNG